MGLLSRNKRESAPVYATGDAEKSYPYQTAPPGQAVYDEDLHVPTLQHTTERKLMAKIDFYVIPCLCILYLMAFLDRVNLGNARLYGLQDLSNGGLVSPAGLQYSTVLVIFFVPYVLLEIPSNILLKRFTPRVWLSGCMLLFGFVTMMQGVAQSYGGLLAARFFLGVAETGMFPGCFYLISMWYRRHEAQKRYSFFFASTSLAGAFGGLIAAGIGNIDGARGYRAWRWIFIIEGGATCFLALIGFFILPNFPEDAKWLSEEERNYVKARIRADQGRVGAERSVTLKDLASVFSDPKTYLGGLAYFSLVIPAYAYAYFSPSILSLYGYSTIHTQLISVPPWAAAWGLSLITAAFSDWTRHRFGWAILPILVSITGFGLLLGYSGPATRDIQYAALFLAAMGTYSAMPIIVCWFQMNLGGHSRRAIGTGWQVGFGNCGAFISTFTFLSKDAPRYIPGYSICVAFVAFSGVCCVLYFLSCYVSNRHRDRAPHDLGLTEHDKTALGDLSPDYRYQL